MASCVAFRKSLTADQVASKRRHIRELGRGGMGVVYLAIRAADTALVALKTIRPAVAGTKKDVERFLREADILGQLNHPNIVAFREIVLQLA